ncbi:MAG: RDD family protein [Ginsengibacter sp.]
MSVVQIPTPFNVDLEFETAELQKRILAYLIDFFILLGYFFIMKIIYYGGFDVSMSTLKSRIGIDILTISLPMLLYSLVCEILLHGQTLGKKAMGIRVLNVEGGEPSIGQYIIRWMFKAFEWPFLFGYTFFSRESIIVYSFITGFLGLLVVLIIAITKKHQRLGDVAANTVIVNTKTNLSVNDTIFMNITINDYKVLFPEVLKLTDRDINTIKAVVNQFYKTHNSATCNRVASKIKEVLKVQTNLYDIEFLEKLLEDYNFLATKD